MFGQSGPKQKLACHEGFSFTRDPCHAGSRWRRDAPGRALGSGRKGMGRRMHDGEPQAAMGPQYANAPAGSPASPPSRAAMAGHAFPDARFHPGFEPHPGHENIRGLASVFWRRKAWILGPTILAFLASLFVVNMLPVRYTGEARVLLENRETVYSRPDRDNRASDPAIDPEAVASQVQVVMSRDLALRVIRELDLVKVEEFDPIAKGVNPVQAAFVLLGLAQDPRAVPLEERVFQTFLKRLLVFPQGKSRVISIEFQSEDPELAARIANRIAEEYLRREEGAKSETSRVTSDWLDKAIEPLMQRVLAAEAKVEAFRSSRGLFVGANNQTITNQQLSELNSQVATARSLQADMQSRAKLIREALRLGKVFETSEVNNNELVRRLLEQRAQLKAQIANDERTLLPGHPRMKELANQLKDLEGQIRSAAERAARAFDNDARAAGARVESLQAELSSQKKSATLSNEDEVQLKALERDAAALREQLNSYRNKFLDAAARTSENPSPADARVISRASPASEPTFPKKIPIVALVTLGTLLLSMTLIAAGHLMARAENGLDFAVPPQEPLPVPDQRRPDQPAKPAGIGAKLKWPFAKKPASAETEPEPVLPGWLPMPASPAPQETRVWAVPETPMRADEASWAGRPREGLGPDWARGPSQEIAHEIAQELAMLGFLGRAKILLVFGHGPEIRTSLHAMRFARRLAQDGAGLIVDFTGRSPLYRRALGSAEMTGANEGPGLGDGTRTGAKPGLADYLACAASPADIIHRDVGSSLHILPANGLAKQGGFGPSAKGEILALIDLLAQSYAHIVIDAGAVGGVGEMIAELADAFVLLTSAANESPALRASADRLEGLRGSPVFVLSAAADPLGEAARQPANDRFGAPHSGAA